MHETVKVSFPNFILVSHQIKVQNGNSMLEVFQIHSKQDFYALNMAPSFLMKTSLFT